MSLEDVLTRMCDSLDANTDSQQQLAATMRQCFTGPELAQSLAKAAELAAAAVPAKPRLGRPPGSTKKVEGAAPASPLEQAAQGAAVVQALSTAPDGTYADLQVLVPKLAEEQGRSKVIAIFAQVGVGSGKELQEKAPDKIPAAVVLFRQALGV